MTKKSRQAASRYARRSRQGKRKRPLQPAAPSPEAKLASDKPAPLGQPMGRPAQAGPAQRPAPLVKPGAGGSRAAVQRIASQQTEEVRPKQATEPMPKTSDRLKSPSVPATYAYIASDLKRTGIITGAIFILLIVLVIIFG